MAKAISLKTLALKKYDEFEFTGIYQEVFGNPEKGSLWLVYGKEKQGKTTFSLRLAEYMSQFEPVLYISAEEGLKKSFMKAVTTKAKIDIKNTKIKIIGDEPLEDIEAKLKKRQGPKVVFIDNITVWIDNLMYGGLRKLIKQHPKVTFIFLAHQEESGAPYTSTAKLCSKLADIIVEVSGLMANVTARDANGGQILIDEQTAELIYGSKIKTTTP